MLKSPIGSCVRVKWDIGVEFVPVHPERELPARFETVEYWQQLNRWVRYQPKLKRSMRGKNICFEITYSHEEHPHIERTDACWGVSTIIIDKDKQKVTASWKDFDDSGHDGEATTVSLIEQCERVRTISQPNIRNQSQIRKLLLDTDGACAITGESTHTALECAHIVSVENNGFENIDNVILLRADLHCLYDTGGFKFSRDGRIVKVSKTLSKAYRDILTGKKLDRRLVQRVRTSIEQNL